MSAQTILLIVGLIFMGSAIVGGGLEIKELKIPTLSNLSRILAGAFGGICLFLGLGYSLLPTGEDSSRNSLTATENPAAPAREPLVLIDGLGGEQIDEWVELHLDGQFAGRLRLNAPHPSGRIEVPATNRTALYVIRGGEHVRTPAGIVGREFSGEGSIVLAPGAHLCIRRNTSQGSGPDSSRIWLESAERC
ncbi:MAG TPA: hypothetical protein VLK25_10470 [Allosphingosinicella sp.]|nr:hypothetical protein [Allosphingosinicella sp.]